MLMRTDPFYELERFTQQVFDHFGANSRSAMAPMEAYRDGDQFVVHFDLPGIDPGSIDLSVERDVWIDDRDLQPGLFNDAADFGQMYCPIDDIAKDQFPVETAHGHEIPTRTGVIPPRLAGRLPTVSLRIVSRFHRHASSIA